MNKLLIANVKKSLDRLAGKGDSKRLASPTLPQTTLGLHPLFSSPLFIVSPESCLSSSQDSILGFYVVRNIVRSILIGARPLEAGNLLLSRHFLSAAVASYYTSAFHLLSGILALNGRVWFDAPHIDDTASPGYKAECVIGRLTKKNTWCLESRPRSHGRRWIELEQVYKEQNNRVDAEFLRLLSRLLDYGPYPFGDEDKIMSEGLKRVAQLRHEALYQGFGFDDFAFDLAHDNRAIPTVMDQRAKAFKDFCVYLMKTTLDGLFILIESVRALALPTIRGMLLVNVYTPAFEVTDLSVIDDNQLSEKLKFVLSWLLETRAPSPALNRAETGLSHGSSG